jgi:3,4-dihydroxy 2-butanone 4-phosphate synthase/GTP cyclohydrolase II
MDRTQRIERQTVAEVPLAGLSFQLLKDLGLRRVRLLTNNPKKTDAFIYGGFDLEARDQVPILPSVHEFNERYLATNREKLGHRFPH